MSFKISFVGVGGGVDANVVVVVGVGGGVDVSVVVGVGVGVGDGVTVVEGNFCYYIYANQQSRTRGVTCLNMLISFLHSHTFSCRDTLSVSRALHLSLSYVN